MLFQIIHWNSPKKFGLVSNDAKIFRSLANTIFELNGNWFRRYPQLCHDDPEIQLNVSLNKMFNLDVLETFDFNHV